MKDYEAFEGHILDHWKEQGYIDWPHGRVKGDNKVTSSSDGVEGFTFYCPYCDAEYDNYYVSIIKIRKDIDMEVHCDACNNKFRLQTYRETVVETSKRLEG